MKLVEQELWQREEKGLIGILPVRDTAEMTTVVPLLSQGERNFLFVTLAPLLGGPLYTHPCTWVNPFRRFSLFYTFIYQKGEREKLFFVLVVMSTFGLSFFHCMF